MTTQTPADIRAIPDLRERYDAVDPAREAHLAAIAELAQIPRDIVMELRGRNLSQERVADVLGVSRARVQQLARSAGEAPEPYRAPLSKEQRAAIRKRHVPGRLGNTRALATEFGVTPATILKIVKS